MKIVLEIGSKSQLDAVLTQLEAMFTSANTDTWGSTRGEEIAASALDAAIRGDCDMPADILRVVPVYQQLAAHWERVGTQAGRCAPPESQQAAVARLRKRKLSPMLAA